MANRCFVGLITCLAGGSRRPHVRPDARMSGSSRRQTRVLLYRPRAVSALSEAHIQYIIQTGDDAK